MRRLVTFFLFLLSANTFAATYYVSTTGVDGAGRSGSVSQPWATLSYACTRVTTTGDVIYIYNGSYAESSRASLSVGVSLRGQSEAGAIIDYTYVSSSSSDAAMYLYSASLTNGNQTISYLTIRGSDFTATRAILIHHRYNVDISHCTIEDFAATGIHFKHQIDWMTPPTTYASGNSVTDCTIRNCADRNYSSIDPGNIRIDGQETFDITNCTLDNTDKAEGYNGNTLNVTNCRGVTIDGCEFYKPDDEGSQWNFYGEIFHLQGGFEVKNCTFTGSATLDFSNAYNGATTRGAYDFSISVHDCYMSTTTGYQISQSGVGHNPIALQAEKGEYEYVYFYNNHIKGYAYGIMFSTSTSYNNTLEHIYVYNNLLENIGYTDYQFTYAISVILENNGGYSVTLDDIRVVNNTITGGSGYNYNGIRWVANGTATNVTIGNNIIYGFDHYPIYFSIQSGESASITNMAVTYNCLNNNYTNSIYVNAGISQTNVNTSTGNTTHNPTFISSTDFHLQESSPIIGLGSAAIQLSSTDYDDVAWETPPSIGAYEYVSGEPVAPVIYYVSNSGNDSYSGTTTIAPWQTISKVNSASLNPGDQVLFRRGDTWREQISLIVQSGDATGDITYGAYGTGNDPLILGSKQENSTSDWTNVGTNLWRNTDATFTNANGGVGNLIFNNEASIGWKVYSLSDLNSQGDFYFDLTNQYLTVYSTSNPASYYSNIECALGKDGIRLWSSQDYVTIENLDIRYYAAHGVSAGGGVDHITIKYCHFQYIGGGDFDSGSYGNGIQFWGSCSNILTERNTFYEIYDAAITHQYSGSSVVTVSNFVVRFNIVDRAYYSWEHFLSSPIGSSVNGMYVQNNTFIDPGEAWSNAQRPLDQDNSRHIMMWATTSNATYSNQFIRNNICTGNAESAIHIATETTPRWTFDYNLYNVSVVCYDGATYTTLSQWQTARSQDPHSVTGSPGFVSSTDRHLSSTSSPAYHAGTNVGYSTDFDGVSFGNPPSMGAYEYVATPEPDPEPEPGTGYVEGRTVLTKGTSPLKSIRGNILIKK